MWTKRCQTPAPSTLAALYRSGRIDLSVTSIKMVASGTSFQTKALAISARVLCASPSITMILSMQSELQQQPVERAVTGVVDPFPHQPVGHVRDRPGNQQDRARARGGRGNSSFSSNAISVAMTIMAVTDSRVKLTVRSTDSQNSESWNTFT